MASYSYTDTIIVWSENKEIVKFAKEIAKELGIQVYIPAHTIDLIAIPCFLKIIDSKHLKALLIELGDEIEEYFTYDECKMIIYGDLRFVLPGAVKNIAEKTPPLISKKYLHRIIKKEFDLAKKEARFRKDQYKKRAFRALYLYHLIENGENLNIEKISSRLDLDNRTINRDIELLKDIYPGLQVFYEKKGDITTRRAPRKKAGAKKVNVKQNQLKDSVARIISLYQILKNSKAINVSKYCSEYGKSEKTLARDIKILREVNPERIISYNKTKGYY